MRAALCTLPALVAFFAEGLSASAADGAASLESVVPDPAPPRLIMKRHYFVSNESFPERFEASVAGRGGALVGVGTDQNYFLAAWARAERIVVVDFDQVIVDLHLVYRDFFAAAETPEAFLALWLDPEAGAAALRARARSPEELARALAAHKTAYAYVASRLKQARKRYRLWNHPTFMNDRSQYDHLRALASSGRMNAVRGDFTRDGAVRGIGDALRAAGEHVGVLYLSNLEEYFPYAPALAKNLLALPYGEGASVLRTISWKGSIGDGYRYYHQPADALRTWLTPTPILNIAEIVRLGRPKKRADVWELGPAESH